MQEEWRSVIGFEEAYEVSNLGRVREIGKNRILTQSTVKKGYLVVHLHKRMKTVHRLVASAFIANDKNKPCIDHIDGDKQNNCVKNLRWCTVKENQNNPITKKRISKACKGKNYGRMNHKLEAVFCIELNKFFESELEAQRETEVFGTNISKVVRGHRNTAGGYHWRYATFDEIKEANSDIVCNS